MEKTIYIDQGSDYNQTFVTGEDLTGFTVTGQIRKWYDAAEYTYFECAVTNQNNGTFEMYLSSDDTAYLRPGRMVYDVLASASSGVRKRILQGTAMVSPGLTNVIPSNQTTFDENVDLEIIQGSEFIYIVEVRETDGSLSDLTGYTAEMQLRPNVNSKIVLMDLNTTNGRLIIGNGTVQITLTDTETASLTFDSAVYDIEITSPNADTSRIVGGDVYLILNITK